MTTLHYGIIGCGVIGAVHAHAISLLPDARLVGVCDIMPERAADVAQQFGATYTTTDFHQLLARPDIDAICVCTPHYLHAEMSIAAAQAGKHVLCEKPMALDPRDMDAMIAAADQAGTQLGICFQHRFDPVMVQLKRIIEDGKFGQLLLGGAHIRCLRDDAYYNSADWRGTWAYEGGGVLINQAIHFIDLMLWLLGDATAVSGTYDTLRWGHCIEVEDTASAILTFANGAQGHIAATNASHMNWQTRLQVYGTEGSVEVNVGDPEDFTFLQVVDGSCQLTVEEEETCEPAVGKACYGNSHSRVLESFTACLLEGRTFPITGREGRKATEAVLGVYRSARVNAPVALPLGIEAAVKR
ncbi:MAG TPA: Gfo/Idh/MocA family oxidoreductase [Armatimonadota bacterium]|jgi:predicted dehydrogenase